MLASICIATRNKPSLLQQTLFSITRQRVPFPYEIIVVDDCSPTPETEEICTKKFPGVHYIRIDHSSGYRNPSVARNVAYRKASGKVIIAQSDDVVHHTRDVIERLTTDLRVGDFNIATVYNLAADGSIDTGCPVYTGHTYKRPFFFLGSLWRRDLYAIGGNDEEFIHPGFDDDWFGECLIRGLGLRPNYVTNVVGNHLFHTRPNVAEAYNKSGELFRSKVAAGVWCASGGPWEYKE